MRDIYGAWHLELVPAGVCMLAGLRSLSKVNPESLTAYLLASKHTVAFSLSSAALNIATLTLESLRHVLGV